MARGQTGLPGTRVQPSPPPSQAIHAPSAAWLELEDSAGVLSGLGIDKPTAEGHLLAELAAKWRQPDRPPHRPRERVLPCGMAGPDLTSEPDPVAAFDRTRAIAATNAKAARSAAVCSRAGAAKAHAPAPAGS